LGFIAGLGGSLLAYRQGVVTWDSFSALGGLTVLATAYLAGVTSVNGGVHAGIIGSSGIIFFITDRWVNFGDWFPLISGVLLVFTLLQHPEGIATIGAELGAKLYRLPIVRRFVPEEEAAPSAPVRPVVAAPRAPVAAASTVLDVDELTVRYGGVVAVSEVSLQVPAGAIVGLIGPNGAGKTSVIDAVTGFARAEGTVSLEGTRVDRLPAHQRVRKGMARTFQSLELYDDLTVQENVSAAAFGVKGAARHDAVHRALELVGIGDLRYRDAGDLSQGQRQLVSIARACAAVPRVLLLDEPAAGLDTTESKWLGERIRNISATGTGILLVDHDVALVLSICDHIYVLDFGSVIAEGPPDSIRTNRTVADAYLGTVHDATVATA